MRSAKIRVLVPLFFTMLALMACNLNVNMPSNPKPPLPNFTATTADADAFEKVFQQAIQQATQTRTFSATITQQQLSAWLDLRAATLAQQQGYTFPLKNVQAALDNGKITLYGVVVQKNVPETPVQVIFTPGIDANGEITASVDSGQFGIVSVPADLLTQLNTTIKQTLTNQLAQIKGRYRLTTLTVSGGSLTVSGQITQ